MLKDKLKVYLDKKAASSGYYNEFNDLLNKMESDKHKRKNSDDGM